MAASVLPALNRSLGAFGAPPTTKASAIASPHARPKPSMQEAVTPLTVVGSTTPG